MVDALGQLVVALGVVLLLFGASLSVKGVGFLGVVLGGGLGWVLAPHLAAVVDVDGTASAVVAIAVGALIGLSLARSVLSIALAIMSFTVGSFYGAVVIAPAIADMAWYLDAATGIGIGLAVAGTSLVATRLTLVVVTAAAGAALASRQVTMDALRTAGSDFAIDPLAFAVADPLFLGLLAFGILTQVGLFKLWFLTGALARLPGLGGRGRAS